MATTANFGWTKPTNGGDSGAWGTELNATLDAIDAQVNLYALKSGAVMTGRFDLKTSSTVLSTLGTLSGAVALDLSIADYFTLTINGATTLSITNITGNVRSWVLMLTSSGAQAVTWPAGTKWPSGTPPALTAGGTDMIVFWYDGTLRAVATLDIR